MADKTQTSSLVKKTAVEKLTGTVTGSRFVVRLDDINIGDKWDASVLPILAKDGIGRTELMDGVTAFIFRDSAKSEIHFTADSGHLSVSAFYADVPEEKKA